MTHLRRFLRSLPIPVIAARIQSPTRALVPHRRRAPRVRRANCMRRVSSKTGLSSGELAAASTPYVYMAAGSDSPTCGRAADSFGARCAGGHWRARASRFVSALPAFEALVGDGLFTALVQPPGATLFMLPVHAVQGTSLQTAAQSSFCACCVPCAWDELELEIDAPAGWLYRLEGDDAAGDLDVGGHIVMQLRVRDGQAWVDAIDRHRTRRPAVSQEVARDDWTEEGA